MRAFVITGPRRAEVRDVAPPVRRPGRGRRRRRAGRRVRHRHRVLHRRDGLPAQRQAAYPMRIGHEWCGTVAAVGAGVDPAWIGRRVTGDTMLGCGRCRRCRQRAPAPVRRPVRDRHPRRLARRAGRAAAGAGRPRCTPLPDTVDATLGALVEPGGNALRAVRAAALRPGERLLVLGPGTIGLLVAQIAARRRAPRCTCSAVSDAVAGLRPLARLRATRGPAATLPALRYDAVIDASNAADAAGARRSTWSSPAAGWSTSDSPASPSLRRHPHARAQGRHRGRRPQRLRRAGRRDRAVRLGPVDPRPLVAATVGLDEVAEVLAGHRPAAWGAAPKVHVVPYR